MSAGRSTNLLTQTEPIYKLFELIHLQIYATQPITTRRVLVRVSGLSFTTRGPVDQTQWYDFNYFLLF